MGFGAVIWNQVTFSVTWFVALAESSSHFGNLILAVSKSSYQNDNLIASVAKPPELSFWELRFLSVTRHSHSVKISWPKWPLDSTCNASRSLKIRCRHPALDFTRNKISGSKWPTEKTGRADGHGFVNLCLSTFSEQELQTFAPYFDVKRWRWILFPTTWLSLRPYRNICPMPAFFWTQTWATQQSCSTPCCWIG